MSPDADTYMGNDRGLRGVDACVLLSVPCASLGPPRQHAYTAHRGECECSACLYAEDEGAS